MLSVDLVAVAVALGDLLPPVGLRSERAGGQAAGVFPEAHGPSQLFDAQQITQLVNDLVRRAVVNSVESAPPMPQALRANSITAHCIPRQMPKKGTRFSRA